MKIKSKHILVNGIRHELIDEKQGWIKRMNFECIVTNDSYGKTISITDGKVQYTFPFEPLERYLK